MTKQHKLDLALISASYSSLPKYQSDEALVRTPLAFVELSTYSVRCSFQNYTDYFKCITAKGEDFAPCKQFKRAYNSLCPSTYPSALLCYQLTDSIWCRFVGEHTTKLWSIVSRLKFSSQIEKWDDQREKGTFPASLEP